MVDRLRVCPDRHCRVMGLFCRLQVVQEVPGQAETCSSCPWKTTGWRVARGWTPRRTSMGIMKNWHDPARLMQEGA